MTTIPPGPQSQIESGAKDLAIGDLRCPHLIVDLGSYRRARLLQYPEGLLESYFRAGLSRLLQVSLGNCRLVPLLCPLEAPWKIGALVPLGAP